MKEIIKQLIAERKNIHDEDDVRLEKFWEKASTEFAKDINKSIKFMVDDCTGDELTWISEFFEEIVEKTQSKEFIECIRKVCDKYPDIAKKHNIIENLIFAEQCLNS